MKLKEFDYIMTHDEFCCNNIANNYYLLFTLIMGFTILMIIGGIGWLVYLSRFL